MSILGFGLWDSSGPFPLSAHYGLYKRGMDPPTNPSRHLKKERSALPLKWLLKEGRGRSPTAVAAATATPCPGHCSSRLSSRRRRCLRPPPPTPPPERCAAIPSASLHRSRCSLLHLLCSSSTISTVFFLQLYLTFPSPAISPLGC